MSLDSIDVDGLERKDRAELATIAEALGGKPTSRTKKADIIGMILDLAGVTSAGPDAAPAAPAAPARNGRNGAAGADTEAAPAEADAEASDGGQGPSDRDRSDEPESKPENEPEGQVDQDQDQGGKSQGGKSQGGKSQGGQNQGGQNKGGQNRNQGGQNQQNQQNQNQGGQNQGEPEPGNRRRRRRRGRDRDRQGEDAGQPQNDNWDGEPVEVAGFLDLRDEGYGFLRVKGFLPSRDDVYVSVKQTRQLGLRKGDFLEGASRPAGRGEKNPALLRIDKVNGGDPEKARERPRFEDLTPLFPDERLRLEREDLPGDMTSRIVDLIAPIGKGQRGPDRVAAQGG